MADIEQNQRWKNFFNAEKQLFDYLNSQAECLYAIGALEYQRFFSLSGAELERPPKFIHWIARLKEHEHEFLRLQNEVCLSYKNALGDAFKSFPVRFSEFYRDIEQINITTHPAIQSLPVKKDGFTLVKSSVFNADDIDSIQFQFDSYVKTCVAAGLKAKTEIDLLGNPSINLLISSSDLFSFSGASRIQKRKCTGEQYRARIRKNGASSGQRVKFGLIVLDVNSQALIFHPAPQGQRPHALDSKNKEIVLPVPSDWQFYNVSEGNG